MAQKLYKAGNFILDLNGKRMSRNGIEFCDVRDTHEAPKFILKYLSDKYTKKIKKDDIGRKILSLDILNKDSHTEDSFSSDIKDVFIIARQYATDAKLDLITTPNLDNYSSSLKYYKDGKYIENNTFDEKGNHIVNDIIDIEGNTRPMLFSELQLLADSGCDVTIVPHERPHNKKIYILPDTLKTTVRHKEDMIKDIYIYMKSNKKDSSDFSNLYIDDHVNKDKVIHLNEEDFYAKTILSHELIDSHFKPPISTLNGHKEFFISNKLGLFSKDTADVFFDKNPNTIINVAVKKRRFINLLDFHLESDEKDNVKDITERLLHIMEHNKKGEQLYKYDSYNAVDVYDTYNTLKKIKAFFDNKIQQNTLEGSTL